jgi:hypothetical protein
MTSSPAPFALPQPHPDVLCRPVSEGAVLLHTTDEIYFGLNEVGLLIWELLPPASHTVDEVVGKLAARFPEVDAAEIRTDVEELLQGLAENGLVLPRTGGAPADG